jgi:signal peptidase II
MLGVQEQRLVSRSQGFVYWIFLFGVALLAILVDQITKAYVVNHLAPYDSWMPIQFIEPVFRITHVHNTGAAFGIFPEGGSIFLVIAVVVSSFILYYYRQLPRGAWLVRLALGLQMGGALGNAVDRIKTGYVVDFFHVERWPVFNVADSCIFMGVVLLALEMMIEEYRANRAPKKQAPEPEETSSPE